MRWILLIIASLCEICWFYCIAYLNHVSWEELSNFSFIHREDAGLVALSILGYAGFGIANLILFTKALRQIAPAVAFSVWTGLALAGITLVDGLFLNIQLSVWQIGSIGLILIGVVGLKFYGNT